ncbi:E3 ubiquitin-protein ligase AIRP2 isoform X2 [Argentina anserina]|uniref:E3 ubiquitin-protein ligase AIRP2 isoform X2 n=1 Tax=Argentina anserina TaxID=57926 RepID=UPI002176223F|nr:E3 ubiquitin-protein ligase AIRP2 isoform X2 [Potentilla anserina]
MRKSFKDSLKALEADIQFANTLASDYPREYDGGCLQMRLSYSPTAQFFLFLIQWTGYHLAGALGLLRILIYRAYEDGKTTKSIHERKASLKEFYKERKQREICSKYKRTDETDKGKLSEIELEREEECGICMEMNSKVVLPKCSHSLCMKCYQNWRTRSQSCPFCRDSLKRVDSCELWIYTSNNEIVDLTTISRENLKRLCIYIEKLPLLVPNHGVVSYDNYR